MDNSFDLLKLKLTTVSEQILSSLAKKARQPKENKIYRKKMKKTKKKKKREGKRLRSTFLLKLNPLALLIQQG